MGALWFFFFRDDVAAGLPIELPDESREVLKASLPDCSGGIGEVR